MEIAFENSENDNTLVKLAFFICKYNSDMLEK